MREGDNLCRTERKRAVLPPFCTLSFVKLILCGIKPEVKSLIFVTVDSCRSQLEGLTQLLVSVFPGSTIYQHTDLCRVPHDVLNNNVDAVFLEAGMDKTNALDFVQMLHRQKSNLPVFILSQTEDLREEAAEAGANDYFVQPVTD
jgi:DNA-binding NarL/FixJ family response regulator